MASSGLSSFHTPSRCIRQNGYSVRTLPRCGPKSRISLVSSASTESNGASRGWPLRHRPIAHIASMGLCGARVPRMAAPYPKVLELRQNVFIAEVHVTIPRWSSRFSICSNERPVSLLIFLTQYFALLLDIQCAECSRTLFPEATLRPCEY